MRSPILAGLAAHWQALQDLFGIAGMTMDEIVRAGRRAAWRPIPGDADYEEILYTTVEASQLILLRDHGAAGFCCLFMLEGP